MSDSGRRLRITEAAPIARGLLDEIDGEAHIVGSVRRLKSTVGDIELIVHEDAIVNIDVGPENALVPADYVTTKGGKENWRFWQLRHVSGYHVELYRFCETNRGSIMLIRTGPPEFSKRFVTCLRSNGYRHEGGYVVQEDQIRPCPSEKLAFILAGMEYLEPEERK